MREPKIRPHSNRVVVRYHQFRNAFFKGKIKILPNDTKNQHASALDKDLPKLQIKRVIRLIVGIVVTHFKQKEIRNAKEHQFIFVLRIFFISNGRITLSKSGLL